MANEILCSFMTVCPNVTMGLQVVTTKENFEASSLNGERELRKTDHTSGCPVKDSDYNI